MKLKRFLKQETVLSVAAVLAVLSMQLVLVLVGLCFFGSMIITNDVSLLTFVPFTFVVLNGLAPDTRRALTIPVVCMQTIAANLGSMLTPIGNPQNLYLYGKSGMSMAEFLLLMFPYTVVSLLLLVGWAVAVCRKQASSCIGALPEQPNTTADRKTILLDAVLFEVCLLAVVRVLPYGVAFAAVLVCTLCADRSTLRNVDYSLLLTSFSSAIWGASRPFRAGCKPSSPGGKCWWQFWLRRSPAMFPLPCSCPGSRMKPPRLSSARISAALAP